MLPAGSREGIDKREPAPVSGGQIEDFEIIKEMIMKNEVLTWFLLPKIARQVS